MGLAHVWWLIRWVVAIPRSLFCVLYSSMPLVVIRSSAGVRMGGVRTGPVKVLLSLRDGDLWVLSLLLSRGAVEDLSLEKSLPAYPATSMCCLFGGGVPGWARVSGEAQGRGGTPDAEEAGEAGEAGIVFIASRLGDSLVVRYRFKEEEDVGGKGERRPSDRKGGGVFVDVLRILAGDWEGVWLTKPASVATLSSQLEHKPLRIILPLGRFKGVLGWHLCKLA